MSGTYRDSRKFTVNVIGGASIIQDHECIDIRERTIYVTAHYLAEPTDDEHGTNRPDYDDEINVFIDDKDDEKLISEYDMQLASLQCREVFRIELMQSVGRKLSFSR